MGVDFTHYVVYGVYYDFDIAEKFDDEEEYEKILDELEDNAHSEKISDGIVTISDGMSGNYTFIGKVIQKSVLEHGGVIPVTRCDNVLKEDIDEVLTFVKNHEVLSKLNDPEVPDCNVGVFVFTHAH